MLISHAKRKLFDLCNRPLKSAHLRFVLAFLVLPNLIFYVARTYVYMMRPVVNIDYLIVGFLSAWLGAFVTVITYSLVFLNDILVNLAPVFHFQIGDAFRYFKDLAHIRFAYSIPITVALIGFAFFLAALAVQLNSARKSTVLVLGLILSICGLDVLNGTSFLEIPIHMNLVNTNVAYSGVRRAVLSLREATEPQNTSYEVLTAKESATGKLFDVARSKQGAELRENIVVVLVESLGLFNDEGIGRHLFEPLQSEAIHDKYYVETGEVPFNGSTIQGEFRELCNVRLLSIGKDNFPTCLPGLLHQEGYETIGIHGFTSQFYNRYRWYPKLGFDQIYFAEDASKLGVRRECGRGFKGLCDVDIAGYIHKQLLNPTVKPKFIHWLTLNSHLPFDSETPKDSQFKCSCNSVTTKSREVCDHTRILHLVLNTIAHIASDPRLPPTQWIIVGDHMPPFYSPKKRSEYSDSKVPYVILNPKNRIIPKLSVAGKGSKGA